MENFLSIDTVISPKKSMKGLITTKNYKATHPLDKKGIQRRLIRVMKGGPMRMSYQD